MLSKWFLKPLLIHSGNQNVQNWVPTWAPTWGERVDFFAFETLLAPSWGLLAPSWGHLAPQMPPKWPQDPPRHLGAILGSFWPRKCAILGRKISQSISGSIAPWVHGLLSQWVNWYTAQWRLVGAAGG